MDELQTELDDGPCLTTIWEQETVHIPDMATESRWLRFAAAAAEAGVGVGAVRRAPCAVRRAPCAVKGTATDAASTVKDEGTSAAQDVQSHAQAATATEA